MNNFWLDIEPTIKRSYLLSHIVILQAEVSPIITQKMVGYEWLSTRSFICFMVAGQSKGRRRQKRVACDVFVDDSYEHFVDLNRNGIFCYLFDAPHNRRYDVGFRRIKSLNELVDFNNIQNNNDEH